MHFLLAHASYLKAKFPSTENWLFFMSKDKKTAIKAVSAVQVGLRNCVIADISKLIVPSQNHFLPFYVFRV